MKARVSPLELHSYFVTEIGCTANSGYDAEKETLLSFEDLQVETRSCPPKTDGNDEENLWRVLLTARQNVGPEKNAAYNFFILLQGWFSVSKSFPSEAIPQLVETTGGSILYGVAREILRNVMASGPYLPLLLPSVSFHPAAPAPTPAAEVSRTVTASAPALPELKPAKKHRAATAK